MMLTLYGFAMIAIFMWLALSRRMSALAALILVPIVFGLLLAPADIGPMALAGLTKLAPTGIMLLFGILFFCLMTDAGVFDPIVRGVLKLAGGDPLKILVGTAVMGVTVALDGDGATTYVICVSALLPIYKRMGLRLQYMATLLIMCIGIMNILPWGGPTARAAASLHLDVANVFVPLIPAMATGFVYLLGVASWFGVRERRRVGRLDPDKFARMTESLDNAPEHRRPRMMPLNVALTAALLVSLVAGVLPLPILFMGGTALALMLNYPSLKEQKERISAHAYNVLAVVGLIFAAGVFTGILDGTGMIDAMSGSMLAIMPEWLGPYMAPATALLSMPGTYLVTNDAFYFGVLPILAHTAQGYGISAAEMARAALLGQPVHLLSPTVASTYLLVSMLDLDYAENLKRSVLWIIGLSLVMLMGAIIFGIIPFRGISA